MELNVLPVAPKGEASFPLDMEGPNFVTGALKVNPAYEEEKQTIIINVKINSFQFEQ